MAGASLPPRGAPANAGAWACGGDARTDVISDTKGGFRSRIGDRSRGYGVACDPWLKTRVVTDAELDDTLFSATARAPLMGFLAEQAKHYWAKGTGYPRCAGLTPWIDKPDARGARAGYRSGNVRTNSFA